MAALAATLLMALFVSPAEAKRHHKHKKPVSTSTSTLSFGNVTVGQPSVAKSVTVKNNGTDPITIKALSGDDFAIADPLLTLPKTLDAGKSIRVPVLFNPLSLGDKRGTLTIVDAADKTLKTVVLKGTGI